MLTNPYHIMPTKRCIICGKEFKTYGDRTKNAKFCSFKCRGKAQSLGIWNAGRRKKYLTKTCPHCGQEFEVPPSRKYRKFCSRECYDDYQTIDKKYSQSKRKARLAEKEERKCEICGYERFIVAAHIISRSRGGTFEKVNILFLCPNHHQLFDRNLLEEEEFGLIKDQIKKAEEYFGLEWIPSKIGK